MRGRGRERVEGGGKREGEKEKEGEEPKLCKNELAYIHD